MRKEQKCPKCHVDPIPRSVKTEGSVIGYWAIRIHYEDGPWFELDPGDWSERKGDSFTVSKDFPRNRRRDAENAVNAVREKVPGLGGPQALKKWSEFQHEIEYARWISSLKPEVNLKTFPEELQRDPLAQQTFARQKVLIAQWQAEQKKRLTWTKKKQDDLAAGLRLINFKSAKNRQANEARSASLIGRRYYKHRKPLVPPRIKHWLRKQWPGIKENYPRDPRPDRIRHLLDEYNENRTKLQGPELTFSQINAVV